MLHILGGFAPLLSPSYWLNPNPVPLGPTLVGGIIMFFVWFLIVSLALYALGIFFTHTDSLIRDVLHRFSWLIAKAGILGFVLLFFAHEQIPLLGMRVWVLVLAVWFLIRLGMLAVYVVRDLPRERIARVEQARKDRYMPHMPHAKQR